MEKNVKKPVRFGIVADLQYGDYPSLKERFFRNSIGKFRAAMQKFNAADLDFIVNLGDTIDRDWLSYDGILPLFQELKTKVYHVLGNHDYEVSLEKRSKVHDKIGTERYYYFVVGGWRFIVLDGNEISTFANPESSDEYKLAEELLDEMQRKQEVNGNFYNGGISRAQICWLEETLADTENSGQNSILFCHYPLYPEDKHNLLNASDLLKVLERFKPVKAWFNGHNHDGNYGQWAETHFLNMRGMVEGQEENAYSIVTLYEDKIHIQGFGREISANLCI